jgi:hypothetical protein
MRVGAPRRNDADDFFAIAILPVRVHYQKDGRDPWLKRNGPKRLPSLLPGVIDAVESEQAVLVVKDQSRQFK